MLGFVREGFHPADEQVVVADGERFDDRALEGRDRAVEERDAGRAGMPCGGAEVAPAGLDGRAGEAIRELALILRQDVHAVPAGRPHDRMQEPAPIERDDHQRRFQ